jgi:hypothetical protein
MKKVKKAHRLHRHRLDGAKEHKGAKNHEGTPSKPTTTPTSATY